MNVTNRDRIEKILRDADRPLTAREIAYRGGHWMTRTQVGRLIVDMENIEVYKHTRRRLYTVTGR